MTHSGVYYIRALLPTVEVFVVNARVEQSPTRPNQMPCQAGSVGNIELREKSATAVYSIFLTQVNSLFSKIIEN